MEHWTRGLLVSNINEDGVTTFGREKRVIRKNGLNLYEMFGWQIPLN